MEPRLPEDPAQLQSLLPEVMRFIRNRRASLLAELESLGGQAPAKEDLTVPLAAELGHECRHAVLQQLALDALSNWYRERSALEAAIAGAGKLASAGQHYYPQFLEPQEANEIMQCLEAERKPYMVKFNEAWRSTVATRPKCNMAEPIDGAWPAYKWGQVNDDLSLIEQPPEAVQKVARRLEERFGHPKGFLNIQLAMFFSLWHEPFSQESPGQGPLVREHGEDREQGTNLQSELGRAAEFRDRGSELARGVQARQDADLLRYPHGVGRSRGAQPGHEHGF